VYTGLKPSNLYDRATGYGIVRFNRASRDITVECWPRLSDPSDADAKQYPGWPIRFNQSDNYGRKVYGYLPTLKVAGMQEPVVSVVNQAGGEVVYTIRMKGAEFRPRVFAAGLYTVKVGEPGTKKMRTIENVEVSTDLDPTNFIEVKF
jgi:hypothetical protein